MDSLDWEGVAASLGLQAHPGSRISAVFHQLQGTAGVLIALSQARDRHRLWGPPAKGYISRVRYRLAVLARGLPPEPIHFHDRDSRNVAVSRSGFMLQ